MNKTYRKFLDKPYLLWSLLFTVAPLVMVAYYALTDKTGAFSMNSFMQIKDYFPTILLSILYGLAATVICLIFGYPFAYIYQSLLSELSAQWCFL